MLPIGEQLRQCMRHWPTGVTVVTSQFEETRHGMTVNSFTSISLDPPVVSITLAHAARTCRLVDRSGIAAITILSEDQAEISDRFAGRIPEDSDRFHGLETFSLVTGAPLIAGGLSFLDSRVRTRVELEHSTLFLLDVIAAQPTGLDRPLVYFNRGYHKLP